MARGKGVRYGRVNTTAAGSADRRTGGLSSEFSRTRNVNKGSFGGRTTAGNSATIGKSQTRSAPFNGSNVYGISTRGGGASPGGGAYGASKGNSTFGSGSARSSSGAKTPKRSGRRGGR